jgi:hypothetical protein
MNAATKFLCGRFDLRQTYHNSRQGTQVPLRAALIRVPGFSWAKVRRNSQGSLSKTGPTAYLDDNTMEL